VDSLGIIAMGFGSFLMFEAIRNKQPTPIKRARDLLKRATPGSSFGQQMQPIPAPTTNTTTA